MYSKASYCSVSSEILTSAELLFWSQSVVLHTKTSDTFPLTEFCEQSLENNSCNKDLVSFSWDMVNKTNRVSERKSHIFWNNWSQVSLQSRFLPTCTSNYFFSNVTGQNHVEFFQFFACSFQRKSAAVFVKGPSAFQHLSAAAWLSVPLQPQWKIATIHFPSKLHPCCTSELLDPDS